ncbi:hypothetical protein TOPH_03823 [Tolypocladium ophioglossoides CBS 100239]|uniref:Uncharacterized protein n=1 Tax=Tolypocladium ophioglossoides (strain CBS 100239) TaxID=1163406 RepID=A0A0L0NBY7_TOLOC|nr:hypothetical protein TOPH_03823 [Tolypocladium ophioglossoides CBS 100239]
MSSRESILGRRKRGSRSPVKSSGTPNTATTKGTGPLYRDPIFWTKLPSPRTTQALAFPLAIL